MTESTPRLDNDSRLIQAIGLGKQMRELIAAVYEEMPVGARVNGVMVNQSFSTALCDLDGTLRIVERLVKL